MLVADAARDFGEKTVIDARERADLLGNHSHGPAFRRINLDPHNIVAGASVVVRLIDADGETARNWR